MIDELLIVTYMITSRVLFPIFKFQLSSFMNMASTEDSKTVLFGSFNLKVSISMQTSLVPGMRCIGIPSFENIVT